jgi:hypothetical protein
MRDRSASSILCILAAAFASGCAAGWKPRSATQATVYASTSEIPVLFADSTFVGEVDGLAIERGKGYALVEPGRRNLTIFNISCPLPVIVVFCLRSVTRRHLQSDLLAGAAYAIEWDRLVEVTPDGKPRVDEPGK